ncbi:hypothetical protein BC830DRAFT_1102249 [Chytriomyces sp. MP71]|nr:hypothetical protein BC830DRAFT_1102249 [Chytriomyces sp. MP71]
MGRGWAIGCAQRRVARVGRRKSEKAQTRPAMPPRKVKGDKWRASLNGPLPDHITAALCGYLDGPAMVRLAHAVPAFKHYSKAMFDVCEQYYQTPFDDMDAQPRLWPNPMLQQRSNPKNRQCIERLLNLANASKGYIRLHPTTPPIARVFCSLIPDKMRVHVSFGSLREVATFAEMLKVLSECRINIDRLELFGFKDQDAHAIALQLERLPYVRELVLNEPFPPAVWTMGLVQVPGLAALVVDSYEKAPIEALQLFPSLTNISFRAKGSAGNVRSVQTKGPGLDSIGGTISFHEYWFTVLLASLENQVTLNCIEFHALEPSAVEKARHCVTMNAYALMRSGWTEVWVPWGGNGVESLFLVRL